jgi:hypothetical protein
MRSRAVAWSNPENREDGYATAAATMIALSLSLVAAATVSAGVSSLALARKELKGTQVEMTLNAAHSEATPTLLTQASGSRLRWTITTDRGLVDMLAEREALKLPLKDAASLGDEQFAKLGVVDPERLRARLRALKAGGSQALSVADFDTAARWRACAASMISAYGRGATFAVQVPKAPSPTLTPSPPGDIWRVRASSGGHWFDERVVRLTGDAHHPAAIVERRSGRSASGQIQCDEVIT